MGGKIKDLTGVRFGGLIAIRLDRTENRKSYWVCRCDCGNESVVRTDQLTRGTTQSCGCPKPPKNDLTGVRFGKLVVLSFYGRGKKSSDMWLCRCDCGKEKIISGSCMVKGNTKSCGCHRSDIMREYRKEHGTTHGMSRDTIYRTWRSMIDRCTNPNSVAYKNYGGRGITVCDRWMSFPNFFVDMGKKPSRDMSLERVNNNGIYEPGNVIWAPMSVQNYNRRSNHMITLNGETLALGQWADRLGISRHKIYSRLRRGLNVDGTALT